MWKRSAVWRLLVIALLAEIAYAVLNISTMPVYLTGSYDPKLGPLPNGRELGTSVMGLVVTAFLLSEAIFKSPMGSLADRFGHKRLMLLGPTITTFTALLTLVVPYRSGALEVVILIALRICDGVAAAMLWPAMFALMGNSVEDDERQQAMSLLNLCYMLGIALALPIGGLANDLSGYKWASLVFASSLFAFAALAVWRWVPSHEPKEAIHAAGAQPEVGFADLFRSMRQIPTYLLLAVVIFAGIGFPMTIMKPFASDEFGMSESVFGFLVFPAAISMAVFSVPLSKFGEKVGKARSVHWGIGLCAAGLLFISMGSLFPFLRTWWALAVGAIPLGIGFLLAIPAWMASVSDIDSERRGANIGAVMTAQGLGAIITAPIGSALYEKLEPYNVHVAHYSPFVGCAVCVIVGWLLSLKLLHEPK